MQNQGQHIEELYQKWVQKTASPEEIEHLFELLDKQNIASTLLPLMKKRWEEAPAAHPYPVDQQEKVLAAILENYPAQPLEDRSPSPVYLLRRWIWMAAAVLIVAGLFTYLWLSPDKTHQVSATQTETEVEKDILPGGNRAILTLADGSKIVLDAAVNGTLAEQGSTKVIKLNDGQLAYQPGDPEKDQLLYNTISTPKGGQYYIVLPDGTKVWLNAASSIKFPAAFTDKERVVSVEGEVYMEVSKSAQQSFRVKTSLGDIKVLGTSFNINTYPETEGVATTLVDGAISINGSTILRPGQQALASANGQPVKVTNQANIEKTLAWKNGLFDFNGSSIQQVMQQLERWYDLEVRYEGNLPQRTFGGRLSRDLTLSQILRILEKMQVKFTVKGKTLIVQ